MGNVIANNEAVDERTEDFDAMQLHQPKAETPPRACFLGLPVELRLHIYSFIAGSPPITIWRHYNFHSPSHSCCGQSSADLAILAMSKHIRAEAEPIIYHTFELSPHHSRVPTSVAERVRNLFILCHGDSGIWCHDYGPHYPGTLASLWSRVRTQYPNVRQIRLRVDHGVSGSVRCGPRYGTMEIPGLQQVIVESYVYRGDGQKNKEAKMLFDFLKADFGRPEHEIEVVEKFLVAA